jgi:hypothetical protein
MRVVVPLLLAIGLLGACGEADPAPAPKGVRFQLEQTRQDLQGRKFSVQVVNGSGKDLAVEHLELESGRLPEPATYDGPTTVFAGTTVNLTMTMPQASCGDGIDATVRIRYSVGDGDVVTSTARPSDHFGSVERFMKRDCAERTLGRLDMDDRLEVQPTDEGPELSIGFTVTRPDKGPSVRLVSVGGSTLLKPPFGADTNIVNEELSAGAPAFHAEVRFVPNRCDVHVVAEDRTGGILPLRVESKAFGTSPVYLRFTEPQKAQIFDYLAERCGFGTEQDPLNAP